MSGLRGYVESLIVGALGRRKASPGIRPPTRGPERPSGFVMGTALPFGSMGPEAGTTVAVSDEMLGKHVAAYGGSGSGKSTLLRRLRRHAYSAGTTVFDLDFLGDSSDGEIRQLVAMGGDAPKVSLIDARPTGRVPALNLLAGNGSAHVRASAMLSAIKSEAESWGVRLNYNALSGLVALAEQGFGVTELQPLFSTEPGFRNHVVANLRDDASRAALEDFGRLAPSAQLQLWQELANKIHPWTFQPELRSMLGQGRIVDLAGLLDRPGRATLVSLGVSRVPAAALVGKLLISAVERHVMGRGDLPESERNPLRIFVDEASRVSGFGLESLLAEGRRMGCSVTLAMQFTGQSEPALRDAIRANCSTLVVFAAGAREAAELAPEVVSDLPRDKVREALVNLAVGEAVVIRRGAPSARVRLTDSPVPAASGAAVERLRRSSVAETSVLAEDAEAAMRERAEWIAGLVGAGSRGAAVVHGRRPGRWEEGDA